MRNQRPLDGHSGGGPGQPDRPSFTDSCLRSSWGILVSAAAGVYALGLLAAFAPHIGTSFSWDGELVNRAVVLAYPKWRETAIYLLACLMIPLICYTAVAVWIRMHEHRAGHRLDALAHLPLLFWIGYYLTPLGSLWGWLAASLALSIVMRVVFGIISRARQNKRSVHDRLESSNECEPARGGPHAPAGTLGKIVFYVAAPLVIYFMAISPGIEGRIDSYHEGERIVPAWMMNNGAVPYQDIFLWHGLFENGFKGQMAFGLDNQTVAAVRHFERYLEPLGAVALFALAWACLGSAGSGAAFTILALFLAAPPNVRYALPYLAFALIAVWWSRPARRRKWLFLAGAVCGLGVFHSLDGGLGAIATAGIVLIASCVDGPISESADRQCAWLPLFSRRCCALGAGIAAGAAIPLCWLAFRGAAGSFFTASLQIAGGLSDRSSRPYAELLPQLEFTRGDPGILLDLFSGKNLPLYLAPLIIVWGLAHLAVRGPFRSRARGQLGVSALIVPLAGAFIFFRIVIRRPDMDHLAKLMPLLLLVIVLLGRPHFHCLLKSIRCRGPAKLSFLAPGILLLTLAAVLLVFARAETGASTAVIGRLTNRTTDPYSDSSGRALRQVNVARAGSGVLGLSHEAREFESLVSYLGKELGEGETFFDFTNRGLLHFLADRPCPTRFVQTTYAAGKTAQEEVIRDLERNEPPLVLFPAGNTFIFGYDRLIHPLRHPLITRYLYEQYDPHTLIESTLILRRRGDQRTPEEPDLHLKRFLDEEAYPADLGHLPRLLGAHRQSAAVLQRWDAGALSHQWRIPPVIRQQSVLEHGRFRLSNHPDGTSVRLTSPALEVDPSPRHAIRVRLRAEQDGSMALFFKCGDAQRFGKQGRIGFLVKAGDEPVDFHLEVGLLPGWVWRGPVTGLQLRVLEGCGAVELERIELVEDVPINDFAIRQ